MCIPLYSMHAYDKKNFSTRYILTFDTGLTFHSLVGLMHLIVRNEVSMGKKEPRINAEFNYRLSLSLFLFQLKLAPSREVASNGLATTSGVASVFSTAQSFYRFLPSCSEYPRSSADINWPKRWYDRPPISTRLRQSRVLSVLSSISWLRANTFFLNTRDLVTIAAFDFFFFLVLKNTSSVHVTSTLR